MACISMATVRAAITFSAKRKSINFFRFYGDVIGQNRLVNLSDFAAFRSAYGMRVGDDGYRWELDFDGNGVINLSDFGSFRARYGKRLDF